MAAQTRSNSFRARTRLKSVMSGASFRIPFWPRSTARTRSELFNFARNGSWQLRRAATRSESRTRLKSVMSGASFPVLLWPRRTARTRSDTAPSRTRALSGLQRPLPGPQNQPKTPLTPARLRDHFRTTSGPAWRPQNTAQDCSKPARPRTFSGPS